MPHDGQCDGRCEERIKAFQKLEAKAMATATMPRRKALKWNKNLPRMRYGRVRDLEYAHRDNVCARCARYLNKELARFKLLSILVCRVWLFVNTFGYFVILSTIYFGHMQIPFIARSHKSRPTSCHWREHRK